MITYYTANRVLTALVGQAQSASFTGTVYAGLSRTAPSPTGANVSEPIGYGYERVLLGNYNQSLTFKMNAPALGATTNKSIIFYGEPTGSWGTITHFLLFDAATGGNLLAYGELGKYVDGVFVPTPINPVAGTAPLSSVGTITLSLDSIAAGLSSYSMPEFEIQENL